MLPEDWARSTVGEACAIKNNLRLPLSAEERVSMKGPYPYFGPTGVLGNIDHYRLDGEFALIGEDGDHFLKFADRRMTLFFDGKANVNNHAHVIANSESCLAKWFYYWFMHRDLTPVLSRQGVARYKLTKAGLEKLEIWLPPAEEQFRICRLLDVWEKSIFTAERLLANSRKQRLSLLSRLLQTPASSREVVERDRVGSHPPSVQAGIPRLSPMPRDWQRFKLREVLSEVSRPLNLMPQNRYTLLTVKRSRGGVVSRGTLRGKEIKTASQSMVNSGDFLVSKRQIVHGACGIVPSSLDGAVVSNEYAVLKSDGRLDLGFLRYLSESIYFQQTCFHSSIGVHVEKMIFNTDRWLNFEFNIPPIEEQRRVVRVLDCSASEIERLQHQIAMLRKEKQALMQQLLTGKRRVRLADVAVKVPKTTSTKASVKKPVASKASAKTPIAKDKRP